MQQDKYSAVWVSHSSLGDFIKCPRAYYLHNVYKNPKTGRKMNITNPALALGVAVHEAVEGLARYKAEERFDRSLVDDYLLAWRKVSGKKGGFLSTEEEEEVKERGLAMVRRVMEHPGPLTNKAVRLKDSPSGMLPHFYLSPEDNIILCGKIDWLEHVPEDDSLHVIDFKTGRNEEKEKSLQLPIYQLLLSNLQKRKVSRASYWYLDRNDALTAATLLDIETAKKEVLDAARKVKRAREENVFECPRNGCFACRPFEAVLQGNAEYVGVGEYNQDIYLLSKQ